MRYASYLLLASLACLLSSCAGYQLGGSKPKALAHVTKIHVPLAKNSTQIPRAAAFVTNGVVDALVRDGTYRLGSSEDADATLYVDFYQVDYSAIRTAEVNRPRPEELSMTVTFRWKVMDGKIVDNYVMVDFPDVLAQLGVDVFGGEGWEAYDNG